MFIFLSKGAFNLTFLHYKYQCNVPVQTFVTSLSNQAEYVHQILFYIMAIIRLTMVIQKKVHEAEYFFITFVT